MNSADSTSHPINRQGRIAVLAFICFAFFLQLGLALPRVGGTIFLADQIDQIQQFFNLLKGDLTALYGPYMSATNPKVFNLGPLGAVLFGLPTALGADPNALHVIFILLLGVSFIPFILEVARYNGPLAMIWTATIIALPNFWWLHSLIWVNIFLLPMSFFTLASYLAFLRKKDLKSFVILFSLFAFGLHIHSSSFLALPLMVHASIVLFFEIKKKKLAWTLPLSAALLLALACLPYTIAEVASSFQNTRAAFQNLGTHSDPKAGFDAAVTATSMLFTTFGIAYGSQIFWIASVALSLALAYFCWASFKRIREDIGSPLDYFTLMWPLLLLFQFFFFKKMGRPLQGPHYTVYFLPIITFPWALILSRILARIKMESALAFTAAVAISLVSFRSIDKEFHAYPWNFSSTKTSLEKICEETPVVRTWEHGSFVGYIEGIRPVLSYIIHNYIPGCEVVNSSDYVLLPRMNSDFAESIQVEGVEYVRKRVDGPGIAVYERSGLTGSSL